MKYLLTIFLTIRPFTCVIADSTNCKTSRNYGANSITFTCREQTNLMKLDRAKTNTTSIEISNSNIPNIHGHAFARFGASLVSLDLHESGIETIDSLAFVGLTKLENLILWGNKLRTVPRDWFAYSHNLRTLDLSFNSIDVIDYAVFSLLPNLVSLYFDYNQIKFIDYSMLAYMTNLKNVKFDKNPLQWGYRAHLIWQLQNQRVSFTEDWENWGWMNVVIKECTESGYGEIPKDTVLDCIVWKLLDFTGETFPANGKQLATSCDGKAQQLVRCMRPKNGTGNTDNETVRRILEDYTAVLVPMLRSRSRFSTN